MSCASNKFAFTASKLQSFDQPFESVVTVLTLRECLQLCWNSRCARAAFTRFPRPTCLLHYSEERHSLRDFGCGNASFESDVDNLRLRSDWKFSSIPEIVEITCLTCEPLKDVNEPKDKDTDEIITEKAVRKIQNPQGASSKCAGRVEFQVSPVSSLPRLNVSNDVPADSPADCARKCFERDDCSVAGFVPTSGGKGVCLLTTDTGVCNEAANHVPQHASVAAFVITCIKCSSEYCKLLKKNKPSNTFI